MYNIIDGKLISQSLFLELKEKVLSLKNDNIAINLVDIQVGDDPASTIYIQNKKKKFDEVGINFVHIKLDNKISENDLINKIFELNEDKTVDAIFVELPLPSHISEKKVIDAIDYKKDVDGFNIKNVGALSSFSSGFYPCTAEGIIELLKRSDISIEGKHAVVIGRSNIVGKPVANLLLKENATVTVCHSKTIDIKNITNMADILVVATGKKKAIDDTYVKDGAIVVDVGIHRDMIDGKTIICGDVDFDKVANKCSYITPVPGGVGPMTIMMLIKHCIMTKNNE